MPYDAQGNYTAVAQRDANGDFNPPSPPQTSSTGILTAARVAALVAKEFG